MLNVPTRLQSERAQKLINVQVRVLLFVETFKTGQTDRLEEHLHTTEARELVYWHFLTSQLNTPPWILITLLGSHQEKSTPTQWCRILCTHFCGKTGLSCVMREWDDSINMNQKLHCSALKVWGWSSVICGRWLYGTVCVFVCAGFGVSVQLHSIKGPLCFSIWERAAGSFCTTQHSLTTKATFPSATSVLPRVLVLPHSSGQSNGSGTADRF